jgi:hypothetical protein
VDSTADLQQLADWLEPLIQRLEPRERASLPAPWPASCASARPPASPASGS